MSAREPAIALRPAVPGDASFFASVYASTRDRELAPLPWSQEQKRAFLARQFDAQTRHYARHYADASFDVVLVDGVAAGRLIVDRTGELLHVVDIALLPEFRSRGVGSRLLRPLLDEAEARGVPVSIHVERLNPALTLYRRLGFAPVDDDGVYYRLERPPVPVQPKIAS